jgi:hypothetical protein
MGPNRIGALGMRVNGKRTPKESPLPPLPAEAAQKRTRADSEPTPLPNTNDITGDKTPGSNDTNQESLIQVSKRRSAGGSSLSEMASTFFEKAGAASLLQEKAPIAAVPNMTRIQELQARRRHRRARFSSSGTNGTKPVVVSGSSPKPDGSSDEGGDIETSPNSPIEEEFSDEGEGGSDVDEDFDPYVTFLSGKE